MGRSLQGSVYDGEGTRSRASARADQAATAHGSHNATHFSLLQWEGASNAACPKVVRVKSVLNRSEFSHPCMFCFVMKILSVWPSPLQYSQCSTILRSSYYSLFNSSLSGGTFWIPWIFRCNLPRSWNLSPKSMLERSLDSAITSIASCLTLSIIL